MNENPSITIKTGGETHPRYHYFDYENNPPRKYALLHIRIRNDAACENARTIYVYYGNNKKCFIEYLKNNSDEEIDNSNIQDFLQYIGIWIDEWVRRRNGDYFRLYQIDYINEETPKVMLKRIKKKIRGNDEEHFKLSENKIYNFDDMTTQLPNEFVIHHFTTSKNLMCIFNN